MAPQRRYYYDLHTHTKRYSADSTIRAEDALQMARWRGLNGIVFTEHGRVWTAEELEDLKQQAQCHDLTVLSGCEWRTQSDGRCTGDLLLYGIDHIPEETASIDAVCRMVHSQGGVVVAAHPLVPIYGIDAEIHSADIDGIEVGNHRHFVAANYRHLFQLCSERNLAGLANSDAHSLRDIGTFCIETDRPILCNADLVEVIRLNQCRPRLRKPISSILKFIQKIMFRS